MDNQGITAQRLAAMQAQQQGPFSGGIFGSLQSASSLLSPFREPVVSQQFAQARQQSGLGGLLGSTGSGIFGPPLLPASRYKRRPSSPTGPMAEGPYVSSSELLSSRPKKIRDYSEHLTQKDEKILPIDKR